jgi:hypothetical protein
LTDDSNLNWVRRRRDVQAKHNIPDRKICIASAIDSPYALEIAKLCQFDYRNYPGAKKHEYNLIYCYGFMCDLDNIQHSTGIFFQHYGHKIIHWVGPDIISLMNLKWRDVNRFQETVLQKVGTHYCMSQMHQKILERMYLTPEVVLPPVRLENADTKIDSISINDNGLIDLMKRAMPDAEFRFNDLSCKITVHFEDRIPNVIKSLCYGNYVITNEFFPSTYHLEGYSNHAELRKMLTHTLRSIQNSKPEVDQKDVDSYREKVQSSYFKSKLEKIAEKKFSKYGRMEDITENTKGVFSA